MAMVVGVTPAALVGTSPLRDMRAGGPTGTAAGLGVGGLVLLSITLPLVLRVTARLCGFSGTALVVVSFLLPAA